jgi:hypothetical protein
MEPEAMKRISVRDVGAPDLELRNSPIVDYDIEELEFTDCETESGFCYFNGVAHKVGTFAFSGNEPLKCEEGDVWCINVPLTNSLERPWRRTDFGSGRFVGTTLAR